MRIIHDGVSTDHTVVAESAYGIAIICAITILYINNY